MQMIVREVEGRRLWSFTVDEKMLYEILCNQIAWRILNKSGNDVETVKKQTVQLAGSCHRRTDEELKTITDLFVRAVFQERKRLKLEDYQLKGKEEE